jgi:Lhr-like helicase
MGFTAPTPIQGATIPVALMGKDICACAATGTGKSKTAYSSKYNLLELKENAQPSYHPCISHVQNSDQCKLMA